MNFGALYPSQNNDAALGVPPAAPAVGASQEGEIAVNPQTGARLVFGQLFRRKHRAFGSQAYQFLGAVTSLDVLSRADIRTSLRMNLVTLHAAELLQRLTDVGSCLADAAWFKDAAMLDATCSAACLIGSAARCAYRAVV